MAIESTPLASIRDFENTINQIKDIITARIIADDNNTIEEIHVLANSNRAPKQVVRDIESAIMAKYGVQLDHKKISVAQMQCDEEKPLAPNNVRPRVVSVNLYTSNGRAEARVELEIGDIIYAGVAKGPATSINKLRLIVTATLNALEELFKGTLHFQVEDITLINLARREAAIVAVSVVTKMGEEVLIGTAFVKEDEREAIVKATLGGINRRLSLLINE